MKTTVPEHPKFFIITQPRTGSNNLSYVLNAHPWLTVGNELLHPVNGIRFSPELVGGFQVTGEQENYPMENHWVSRYPDAVMFGIVDMLLREHDGFKIHTSHLPAGKFSSLIRHYRGCKYIFTERRSKFEQAISNYIAIESSVWHANDRLNKGVDNAGLKVAIDPAWMVDWISIQLTESSAFKQTLREAGIDYRVVVLEEFFNGSVEHMLPGVDGLFEYLGVPRLGQLESRSEQAQACDTIRLYLDPDKQRVIRGDMKDLVENYQELEEAYRRLFG